MLSEQKERAPRRMRLPFVGIPAPGHAVGGRVCVCVCVHAQASNNSTYSNFPQKRI